MCDAGRTRMWRPGPLTPAMRALLTQMAATDAPIIDAWRKPCVLDGQAVNGATVNGLHIRGLASMNYDGRMQFSYRLTDAGRELAETAE